MVSNAKIVHTSDTRIHCWHVSQQHFFSLSWPFLLVNHMPPLYKLYYLIWIDKNRSPHRCQVDVWTFKSHKWFLEPHIGEFFWKGTYHRRLILFCCNKMGDLVFILLLSCLALLVMLKLNVSCKQEPHEVEHHPIKHTMTDIKIA